MNGVAIRIYRDGQFETVWLWTGRSGEQGKLIRRLARECEEIEQRWIMGQRTVILCAMEAEKNEELSIEQLDALSEKQNAAIAAASDLKATLTDTAAQLAQAAFEANYGREEATRIVDLLTDAQVRQIPRALETGLEPPDFFPARATPPSGSATLPDESSPDGSPSTGESRPAESDPETPT